MTLGIVLETAPRERRVALVPQVLPPLIAAGLDVVVQASAGRAAGAGDTHYEQAGARIGTVADAWQADLVVCVNPPSDEAITRLRKGSVVVSFLRPLEEPERMTRLAGKGVTALAMELVPRISRAQKMDALSAMASLAGYKAVLMAAAELPRFFPLLTTAAGTIRPATVTVLGAGVAGLQAIATARRLGARVWGYDIRDAAREEVQSLGAQFVELELELEDMQDEGGYARALMEAKARQQVELLVPHLSKSDVVITTALIPGRKAPLLISKEAVTAMKSGSIIVDLAAPTGGNCALTRPNETVLHDGVSIMGPTNVPGTMPIDASFLYARTVTAMVTEFVKDGVFTLDFDDEIFKSACVTHDGAVVHARVSNLLAG